MEELSFTNDELEYFDSNLSADIADFDKKRINLLEENERKRLVDFASGLVFGHNGKIERVTSKVFLLSPANVKVSSEDKTAAAEASFFNQS